MFSASAEYYDLIYSAFKNYPAEVEQISSLLRRVNPSCHSLLDVGCGTGEHARLLTAAGFAVDGIDIEPEFVRMAAAKNPTGRFLEADMSDFHLPHRYDAILCLFSSIGYLCTLDRVGCALACVREHLTSGGVSLVEPWFPPGVLDPEKRFTHTAQAQGVKVSRHSRTEIDGLLSRLRFDYEIDDNGTIRRMSEVHELGLFTTDEMTEAFRAAGLAVQHDPAGPSGRGLFIARRAS